MQEQVLSAGKGLGGVPGPVQSVRRQAEGAAGEADRPRSRPHCPRASHICSSDPTSPWGLLLSPCTDEETEAQRG